MRGVEPILLTQAPDGAPNGGIILAQAGEPAVEDIETHEVGGDEAHAEAEHHGPPTELFLLAALIILIAIAFKPAKRAILASLDGRAERIKNELEEAQRLREEAQASLASFQRRQRDAMGEAEEIISHARQEAERLRAQAAKDLEEVLKRRESQAMDRIAQAEAAALTEVRTIAVDVAIAAARQVIGGKLDKEKEAALIDHSIAELPSKLH
ncbi:F0F1 ATP synthase subunit B [Inquilinus sp. CAU 1745]|uniref:F0F1 ATP synthase subunit B family protein n=1 Tax=Inquilinus sp. CAU 1745 TaxID=3140369 RepID=UPI00325B0DE8